MVSVYSLKAIGDKYWQLWYILCCSCNQTSIGIYIFICLDLGNDSSGLVSLGLTWYIIWHLVLSRWSALAFHWEVTRLYERYDLMMWSIIIHNGVLIWVWSMIDTRLHIQIYVIYTVYQHYMTKRRGGTRGGGSVVAYGYATYLALYYTHLALFSLLMVANQCNMSMIITWYGKNLIKEVWFFVSFVIMKIKSYLPSITQVMLER